MITTECPIDQNSPYQLPLVGARFGLSTYMGGGGVLGNHCFSYHHPSWATNISVLFSKWAGPS
jgi:hypothetical protein